MFAKTVFFNKIWIEIIVGPDAFRIQKFIQKVKGKDFFLVTDQNGRFYTFHSDVAHDFHSALWLKFVIVRKSWIFGSKWALLNI